ncbi:MAG: type II secretion system protein [Candidatus Wallbacteria bacterium]|nr:type II secretion system protein [Candidatus Wallbacteria bacterium]
MSPGSRRGRGGMALAEVLIAVLVLAAAMVPVLFLFPSGARRSAFGEAHLRAHLRARALLGQAIDMAVRTGFRDLPENQSVPASDGSKGRETISFEPVRGFEGLWVVTAVVEWAAPLEDGGGGERSYQLQRLLHKSEQSLGADWPLVAGGER